MQSNIDQRILFYDASANSWTDHTKALNDHMNGKTAALSFDSGDYLYVSSLLPFNHKFFGVSTASNDNQSPIIELAAASNEWNQTVDQLDYTDQFAVSGVLQFTTNWDKQWARFSRNVTDLAAMATAPVVYDSYWFRISFAAATQFTLSYIGQLFSSDSDLYAEYPQLQNEAILEGWETGKTTWFDQHVIAANYLAKALIERKITVTRDQILDIATFRSAAVHKTAHIIFSGLGAKNYENEIKQAAANYKEAMTIDKFQVDTNLNARKDISEILVTTSRATR